LSAAAVQTKPVTQYRRPRFQNAVEFRRRAAKMRWNKLAGCLGVGCRWGVGPRVVEPRPVRHHARQAGCV